jgi:hypothetical protein
LSKFKTNGFTLKLPKNVTFKKNVISYFEKFVINPESTSGVHLSNYWDIYLPKVVIKLFPDLNNPKKIIINHDGFTDTLNLTFSNFLIHSLQILRNIFLLIQYKCKLSIILKAVMISIKTRRLFCFDIAKHAILLSKIIPKVKLSSFTKVVVIGDGVGFLGTLVKKILPSVEVAFINLSKNLFLDYVFYSKVINNLDTKVELIEANKFSNFENQPTIFFNVASLSEMTIAQIELYLESIKKVGGTLVSLNRNTKIHPDGTKIELDLLLDKYKAQVIYEENPCSLYEKFPLRGLKKSFLPFDGDSHLKVIAF